MKTALFCATAIALLPAQSFAQDPSDDQLVVTGTRTADPQAADRLGGSLTVVDAQAMRDRQVRDVSDVLRDVPGVAVSSVPGQTQIRLRGTEANHVLVLIDGIEVSDPYQGEFDFSTLAADQAARIEVLRGQQSALYGSDAIGGVVQYITASGREAPGFTARAEGGSFGTFNAAARAAGVTGDLDYALTLTRNDTDGTSGTRTGNRNLGKATTAASLKSTWNPAGNIKISAVGRYSRTVSDFNNQDFTPGSPTFGLAVDSPGSFVRVRGLYGLVRAEASGLDGRWQNALSAQVANTKRDGFDLDAPSYGDRGSRVKGSFESTLRFDEGVTRNSITFAADAERESYRNADPTGSSFTGWRHTNNVGLVGQYNLTAGAFALGGALRHDFNNKFQDATTWRADASYAFDTGTKVHVAGGSGVKNPGFFELYGFIDGRFIGNGSLKPEKSTGWEAGVEQQLAGQALTIGATYFDSRLKNEIFTDYPAPDFVATPANRDTDSKQHGVETFLTARIGTAWRVDASYTYLHAREDHVREVRRPNNIASLAVSWHAPEDRGGVTLVVRYNGQQTDSAYLDPSFVPTTVRLGSYTLVGVNGDIAITRNLSLFGRVENALDKKYEQVFSFTNPGIAAYGGIRARF
ncbi:TonB-dependent receptor plug domain-containing protein [Sphingomonas sp.]|uniref:TonB-dependent receptor plug domain-containing protein n=1 Tax=Sphingomonas sp. TaxID=28214 RepID=UPI003B3A16EE